MNLFQLTQEMALLESTLEENGGELTEELAAAWEETSESLSRKTDGYFTLIKKIESQAKTAADMMDYYSKRKKTAEKAAETLKKHIARCMETFGQDKLQGDLCKMSLRHSESLDVDDQIALDPYKEKIEQMSSQLPEWISLTPKVSKTAIKAQFKGTDLLPQGVQYKQNVSLQIR